MSERKHRIVFTAIGMVSLLIFAFLIWLIYFRETAAVAAERVAFLPALNATFNSLSALCLVLGYRAIRARALETHKRYMLAALAFSALFLVSYVIYHHFHGDTPFMGTGIIRPIYFFILISHIALSAVMLPMILVTLYFALTGNFTRHPKIARWTLPVWLYVSVTGVLIFLLLKFLG